MPWHSRLNADGMLERLPGIQHSAREEPHERSAKTFRKFLEEELHDVALGRDRLLLMLTGGLDSRVVAGVLRHIEPELKAQIVCVTWGFPESRDVVYARRIAGLYDWEFVHVPYDSSVLWANIQRAAIWGGSEVTGVNLHGEDWFQNAGKSDLAIASSFGDSVGRAEFSYHNLLSLRLAPLINTAHLLRPTLAGNWLREAEEWKGLAREAHRANRFKAR